MKHGNRHKYQNLLHALLLLGGMACIAWACVSASFGAAVGLWAMAGLGLGLVVAPKVPKTMLLSLYRARPVSADAFPDGARMLRSLGARAELAKPPVLYYVPSSVPNAFAVGSHEDSAVAVSDGLLRLLDARELYGVLAHEVSHIAHRDLWIMGLADMMARITGTAALFGLFFLALNLPLVLMGEAVVSWVTILILIFSPTIMSLLQLSLSRAREYAADRNAALLTGDPAGLSSALLKIETATGRAWEGMFLPGRRNPNPSLLRSHPRTEERVRRLAQLPSTRPAGPERHIYADGAPGGRGSIVSARPRWHRTGVWY